MGRLYIDNNKIFTHKCNKIGYANDVPYLYYKGDNGVVDGIGRMHINLFFRCDTCNKEVRVAMIHANKDGTLYKKDKK